MDPVAAGAIILTLAGFAVRHQSTALQVAGIASARLATGAFLITPVFLYILMRLGAISIRDLASSIAPAVGSAASVVAVIQLINLFGWLSSAKPTVVLVVETLIGGAIGLLVLLSSDGRLRRSVKGFLRQGFLVPPWN